MLGESTAHRAYILEVDRNRNGTKERVTLLVDYGRNQARVEFAVAPALAPALTQADKLEAYRNELVELVAALSQIVKSPRGLRWMFD
jgi:hypothetical protein